MQLYVLREPFTKYSCGWIREQKPVLQRALYLSSPCSIAGRPTTPVSRDASFHWHRFSENLTAWSVKHATFVRLPTEGLFGFSYRNSAYTFFIFSAVARICYKKYTMQSMKDTSIKCVIQYESSRLFTVATPSSLYGIIFLCGFDLSLWSHVNSCKLQLLFVNRKVLKKKQWQNSY